MSVWAISMFKDEEDVCEPVIRHLLDQDLEGILIADNLSTDNTRPILDAIAAEDDRLVIIDDPEYGYYQARKMTTLARQAAQYGAQWILPFDADEWWYSEHGTIGQVLHDDLPFHMLFTWGYDHRPTAEDDPSDPNPFTRMRWREPAEQHLPKVAFRYHPTAELKMGNHDLDCHPGRRESGFLAFRHFGYRTFEQFARKVRNGKAVYDATGTDLDGHGTHWREQGALNDEALRAAWDAWCSRDGLVYDPCPQ